MLVECTVVISVLSFVTMASIGSWWRVVQNEKDRSSGLESDFEYRERWITIRLVYVSGFLMFLSFGVVTTGLWPYLQDVSSRRSDDAECYRCIMKPFLLDSDGSHGWQAVPECRICRSTCRSVDL